MIRTVEQKRSPTAIALQDAANKYALSLKPLIQEIVVSGIESPLAIANELNARKCPTYRNKKWSGTQVSRLLLKIEILIDIKEKPKKASEES